MNNFQDLNKSNGNVNYPKEIEKVSREINKYAFGFIDRLGVAYKTNKQGFEEYTDLVEKRKNLEDTLKTIPSDEREIREVLVNRITAVKKDIAELSRDGVLKSDMVNKIEEVLRLSGELRDKLEELYTESYNW